MQADRGHFCTPIDTKDGDGFTGEIPTGLSITGRIGIFPAKTDDNGGAQ